MGWAEVFKINSNMKKPLNEQIREARFLPLRIITATGTFTPEKTGLYKVICVGAGGNGYCNMSYNASGGGGGGVAIKTLRLVAGTSYAVTVSSSASFAYSGTAITATAGGAGGSSTAGTGGTGSGGDSNFTGTTGTTTPSYNVHGLPGSVGVYLSELGERRFLNLFSVNQPIEMPYGDCLVGYGGSGAGYARRVDSSNFEALSTKGLPAAIIIIPLEMEG